MRPLKVRTAEGGEERGYDAGKKIKGVAVVHGNAIDRAEALKARVTSELGYTGKIYVTDFGPGLTVHFGPGLLGLAVYGE